MVAYHTILPRPRRRRSRVGRWYRRNARTIVGALGVVAFFAAWQVGSDLGLISTFFFSSPTDIFAAAAGEVVLPRFWNNVRVTAVEVGVGISLAIALAIPLGILAGWNRRLSYLIDPWLNFLYSLPKIAVIPLFVLWAGLGSELKIAIAFFAGFITTMLATVEGVRTTDAQLLEVARSFRAPTRLIFTSLVLPSALPFIVTGIRLAIGTALIGVILAEFYAQTEGLGVMIDKAADLLDSSKMLFGILIFSFTGVFLTELAGYVERRLQRWRPSLDIDEGA